MINVNLLPKHFRRVREAGHWRIIAILLPLVVAGTIGAIQFTYNQTARNLRAERETLQATANELQEFVNQQRELNAELENLRNLISIRDQVQANRIVWSNEITALLETLPARGNAARPRISFDNLSMQAINPPTASEDRYEGESIIAEMNVSGVAASTEVLSEFIGTLEKSEQFGVAFQSASRDGDSNLYTYSMTVGALAGATQ